jgi:hypothetical protein
MNEDQIRAELAALKVALRDGTANLADLQARARRTSSSLAVLIVQDRKATTPLREHDLRELIALWAEIEATLETRAAAG